MWGQWPFVGGFFLRYAVLAIIVLIVSYTFYKAKTSEPLIPQTLSQYLSIALMSPVGVLVCFMIFNALKGRTYPTQGIDLQFPLRNGQFYIANGGANRLLNNHFRPNTKSQQFALDINRLNARGAVSNSIFTTSNESYYSFADTIYCPCAGRIIETQTTIADNSTASMEVAPEDGTGNFVKIDCDAAQVFVAHLKQSSVLVEAGNVVQAGEALGLVGNSGFSQEPHLHIQAAVYDSDSALIGIPMKFKGRYLSRNDRIVN